MSSLVDRRSRSALPAAWEAGFAWRPALVGTLMLGAVAVAFFAQNPNGTLWSAMAPAVKRRAVDDYGGRVIPCAPTLAAREDTEIVTAMRLAWERAKLLIEPSAAVALAAVAGEREQREAERDPAQGRRAEDQPRSPNGAPFGSTTSQRPAI